MRRAVAVCVVAVAAIFAFTGASAKTNLKIPAKYYPAHSKLSVAKLDNKKFDCYWGFFCDAQNGIDYNLPLFHTLPAGCPVDSCADGDTLGRLSGWGQAGTGKVNAHEYLFVVVVSKFKDATSAKFAAADFGASVTDIGFKSFTPAAIDTDAVAGYYADLDGTRWWAETDVVGSMDVEGVGLSQTQYTITRKLVRSDLSKQFSYISSHYLASQSTPTDTPTLTETATATPTSTPTP